MVSMFDCCIYDIAACLPLQKEGRVGDLQCASALARRTLRKPETSGWDEKRIRLFIYFFYKNTFVGV